MSLPTILRNIAQKSQHPNALLHKIQLAKAQRTFLPNELRISDGSHDKAFELGAPSDRNESVDLASTSKEGSVRIKNDKNGKVQEHESSNIASSPGESGHTTEGESSKEKGAIEEELRSAIRYRMLRNTWNRRIPTVEMEHHRAVDFIMPKGGLMSEVVGIGRRREVELRGVDRYVFGVYWYTLFLVAGICGI